VAAIAPLVSGFQRRLANLPGPVQATGEASDGEPVLVEMWINGQWIDITSYVMVRDDQGRITITTGIRDEGSLTEQSRSTLPLNNRDSRFTRRNPTGPYYGYIGRNTPCRISVPDGMGGKSYRQQCEISKWPKGWDPSGNDVWVDVNADGLLQRLSQAPPPERSVIYNAITDPALTGLVAYWPCEDPTGSRTVTSALSGGAGAPMTFTGTPVLATFEQFGASDPLPTLTGASLTGSVAPYDTTSVTQYQARYLLAVPAAGFTNLDVISRVQVEAALIGDVEYLDIHYNNPPGGLGSYGAPGTLSVLPYDGDEAPLAYSGTESPTMDVRGRLLRVSLEVSNNGTALSVVLRLLDVETGDTDSATIGQTSTQVTAVTGVSMAPSTLAGSAGVIEAAVGHVLLQTTITDIEDLGRAIQPTGEAAGRRIQRLCAEEGLPFDWIGDLDDTVAMGPQGKQNLLSLVQEAVLADGGILYESKAVLGLGYRTRASLYQQDPALVLDYTGYNLSETPIPVEDDRYLANRVVVSVNGVTATYSQTDGPLSVLPPPAGVGVYGANSDSPVTLNLASTDVGTLLDQAGWRVRVGTVDEDRHPEISVNLAHDTFTANPAMKQAVLALRLGDRIQIANPPTWVGPDTIDQLVVGLEESITHFEHRLTFTCQPASPYNQVGSVDGAEARVDADGSELLEAVGTSDTELVVVPSAGESMLWTTDSADWPFDARLGGEVVTVTAVTSWLDDGFVRSVSSGWGTADTGQAWSISGGSATDYAVAAGVASHTQTTVNASRRTFLDTPGADFDFYLDVTTSATATGGSLFGGPMGHYVDTNNLHTARMEFTTSNTLILTIRSRVAGTETQLGAYTLTDTYVAGTYYRIRFQAQGPVLRAKAWAASEVEPPTWRITATDSSLSAGTMIGARSIAAAANTNVNPVVSFQNAALVNPQTLTVTRSVNGVIKAQSAGTDIRLAHPTYVAL